MGLKLENNTYYLDSSAVLRPVSKGCDEPLHAHDFVELMYVRRGSCLQTVADTDYSCARGDLLLINYGQSHAIRNAQGLSYVNILLKPEFFHGDFRGRQDAFALLEAQDFCQFRSTVNPTRPLLHFHKAERAQLESLLDQIAAEQRSSAHGSDLMIRSCLNMLLILVFRKLALPLRSDKSSQILPYVQQHCAEKLTLDALAEEYGYDTAYFSRLFKAQAGCTFTQYLTRCRITLACSLLETTDLTVEEIIPRCGFSDRTRFFRVFSAYTKMTPIQYRKSKK